MIEILTVCTGNISRSPLAERLLRMRLGELGVTVSSAGTRALIDHPMDPDAARLAVERGVLSADIAAHRARWVREAHVARPDLILAMSREHRRYVVELDPSRMRVAFTIRELERLAAATSDEDLRRAADAAGSDPRERLSALLRLLASRRGQIPSPAHPLDDDVLDPFGHAWDAYEAAAAQLDPGIDAVVRVVRAAALSPSEHFGA